MDEAMVCKRCSETKLLTEFRDYQMRGKVYKKRLCRSCESKANSHWNRKNPEKVAESSRLWRTKNPGYQPASYQETQAAHKWRQMNLKYGISRKDYQALLEKQGGVCAACKRPEIRRRRDGSLQRLSVDHCHKTGRVRGLLCGNCNTALGLLNDDPVSAELLAIYLLTT